MRWSPDRKPGPARSEYDRVNCILLQLEAGDPIAAIATPTITLGYSGPRVSYLLHAGREILARRPWVETADHDARRNAVRELMHEGETWYRQQAAAQLAKLSR